MIANMARSTDAHARSEAFLAISSQYRLGALPTEQSHPLTRELSTLAQNDLPRAIAVLHQIDCNALGVVVDCIPAIQTLSRSIGKTLDAGHRVFLCGCGATGRLSLACEALWRMEHDRDVLADRVVAFMAGGDAALVRSVEHFEDRSEYGERQLRGLGFGAEDLLVACTEGGETPFVIGATLAAADLSRNAPFFLYCNPDNVLRAAAQRSAQVIDDARINKICLPTGPMALAGSTRMQASTVLMLAVGSALQHHRDPQTVGECARSLTAFWQHAASALIEPLIVREADCYARGGYVAYEADPDCALTVLTDTTERAPTFSMHPFENEQDPDSPLSLCCFVVPGAADRVDAWQSILRRAPRPLSWPDTGGVASRERLMGFDFSAAHVRWRERLAPRARHRRFAAGIEGTHLRLSLDDCACTFPVDGLTRLQTQLVLKMLLNTHSTLVMGRLGRYSGNVMTWVRATNNKLVDRAIRNVAILLENRGVRMTYEQIAHACFVAMETTPADESLVLAAAQILAQRGC
jgi:N-acetylmuramic acid 6-phosphate etherase